MAAGTPGLLFGRYPGDVYMGGNPWQLLTAVTAEVFYLGGTATARRAAEARADFQLAGEDSREWKKLLGLPMEGTTVMELAEKQVPFERRNGGVGWGWTENMVFGKLCVLFLRLGQRRPRRDEPPVGVRPVRRRKGRRADRQVRRHAGENPALVTNGRLCTTQNVALIPQKKRFLPSP